MECVFIHGEQKNMEGEKRTRQLGAALSAQNNAPVRRVPHVPLQVPLARSSSTRLEVLSEDANLELMTRVSDFRFLLTMIKWTEGLG